MSKNADNQKIKSAIEKISNAVHWLKNQDSDYKIIIKQTRNLGDTLHITPIARYYKNNYPKCKIVFVVGDLYCSVHEFNKDFDKIVAIDSKLGPQERIKIGQWMKNNINGIDKVLCPSIFPFGEVWKTHVWSWPIIAQQYFANAEIDPRRMTTYRLNAPITDNDMKFAKNFVKDKKCIGLEYNSYSHPGPWNKNQYHKLIKKLKSIGYVCISFAGANEGLLPNTKDGRGISWRRTIAILSKCDYMIGIGSGITMLAACAMPTPKILEINVSGSISMNACGYAKSEVFVNSTPDMIFEYINKTKGSK
jgi:hypothetical protein